MFIRVDLQRLFLAGTMFVFLSAFASAEDVSSANPPLRRPSRSTRQPTPSRQGTRTRQSRSAVATAAPAPAPAPNEAPVINQAPAAKNAASEALDIPETYEEAMNYGITWFNIGDFKNAEEVFKKVFFMPGRSQDRLAMEWLGKARRALANESELATGEQYYHSGNYSEAAMAFRSSPRDPRAQRWLNRTDQMRLQYDKTVAEIEESMRKGDTSFLYNSKMQQYNTAQLTADQALKVYAGDLKLTQLKDRAAAEIDALENRKNAADSAPENPSTKVNAKLNRLFDKWLGD